MFVLGVFVLFRLLAAVPIPGIDMEGLRAFFQQSEFLGLVNVFTGGALERSSVVMLGLGPYITAVIVMQLLTMIVPSLERMYKEEGEAGRQKFNQYGRLLTVPFAMVQGYGFLTLLSQQGIVASLGALSMVTAIFTITAGTVLLMWLGELISEQGIGNGVSLLIFAGIVASFPGNVGLLADQYAVGALGSLDLLLFAAMAVVILAGVVFVTDARRNIPVSYSKRVRGNKMVGGVSTYLPMNINPAGVIPIIFALSLLTFPGMIASFLQGSGGMLGQIAFWIQDVLNPTSASYQIMYFLLVVAFTYFYTAITFDSKTIASNLQKMGGFIPGVRPGESTISYLLHTLNRVLFLGALFLGTIAILPFIVQNITGVTAFQFLVGGTSLLIIVSVVLETMRQIQAQLQMREYETL